MAEGVQGACVGICFMLAKYEQSENCKLELTFAKELKKPIVPVILAGNGESRALLDCLPCPPLLLRI